MSEGIWVAFIGAIATVVAAVIISRSRSHAEGAIPKAGAPLGENQHHRIPLADSPRAEGRIAEPETGEEAPESAASEASAFPLVESLDQIEENLRQLEAYLQSADDGEKEFGRDLIRRGKCLVVCNRSGRLLAGPSRFVGYAGNTREKFQANEWKHGGDTNWAISQVLGWEPEIEPALEEQYQEFCRRHQIENPAQISRKYWSIE